MRFRRSNRFIFMFIGFMGGVVFLLITTLTIHGNNGSPNTYEVITPNELYLMLEIFLVPFFMGFGGYAIGRAQDKLVGVTDQLREFISDRERDISQEHFYFNALVQNSPLAVVQLDATHHIVSMNPKFQELFGYAEEEIIGKNLDKLVSNPDKLPEATAISEQVIAGDFVHTTTQRYTKSGEAIDVEVFAIPVIVSGQKIGAIGLYQDISRQKTAEHDLQDSEKRYRALFQNSPISLWEEDFSGVRKILENVKVESIGELRNLLLEDHQFLMTCIREINILDVNMATLRLYEAESKEELSELWEVASDLSTDVFVEEFITLYSGNNSFTTEIIQRNLNGNDFQANLNLSIVPGYEDSWGRVIVSIMDITETKDLENQLRHMSFHDSLTGLYNRAYFDQELSRYNVSRMFPMVLAVCDLDGLKAINDTQGHSMGDVAIRTAGNLLAQCARAEDMVARIGGDEYGIIFPRTGEQGAVSISRRIHNRIAEHNALDTDDGLFRPISLSVGIVMVDQDTSMYDGLKMADQKMYDHKRRNRLKKRDLT